MADDETVPTCFVIMPITTPTDRIKDYAGNADHFKHVLESFFVPAIEAAGMKPIKPLFQGSPVIQASIIKNLIEADLVLCDYSILNANVFFELGIRTALNKPVAMVKDDATTIPFDVGPISTHTYDGTMYGPSFEAEKQKLTSHIQAVAAGDERNELWHHFGVTQFAEAPPAGSPLENVEATLAELRTEVRALARRGASAVPRVDVAVHYLDGRRVIEKWHPGAAESARVGAEDLPHTSFVPAGVDAEGRPEYHEVDDYGLEPE